MLRLGARSGYEIKTAVESSVRHCWTVAYPQIYPELRKLENKGLITPLKDQNAARGRKLYKLTAAGRRALHAWLKDLSDLRFEVRDAGLLRFFFADAMTPEERMALIEAMRQRSEEAVARLGEAGYPLAQRMIDERGDSFPMRTGMFGINFHAFMIDWCDRTKRELE
jgi:DNA-binding PadR family transcriptional regulator